MASYSVRGRRKPWFKYALVVAVLVLLAGAISAFIWWQSYAQSLRPVSNDATAKVFVVGAGDTVKEIATNLHEQGLIRKSRAFEQYTTERRIGSKLQAGTYHLAPSYGVAKIAQMMVEGDVAVDLITLLPGQRIDQLKAAFVQAKFDPAAVDAAFDPAQYRDSPVLADLPAGATLEGYLYPETYQKDATTEPSVIVWAALAEMEKYLTPDIRAAFTARGLSLHQAVTLASVVEREVGNNDDRAQVAQVFYKRLSNDRALESDATAIYGAVLAGQKPSVTYDSSYNTYNNKGLPPGPISNVSVSSLRAVAFPADTDWMYFVSGDDGRTHFSKTLAEHEALTKQYCKKLCGN